MADSCYVFTIVLVMTKSRTNILICSLTVCKLVASEWNQTDTLSITYLLKSKLINNTKNQATSHNNMNFCFSPKVRIFGQKSNQPPPPKRDSHFQRNTNILEHSGSYLFTGCITVSSSPGK